MFFSQQNLEQKSTQKYTRFGSGFTRYIELIKMAAFVSNTYFIILLSVFIVDFTFASLLGLQIPFRKPDPNKKVVRFFMINGGK
uniref:Uncharacterized protein n=1 Tax=Ditylenchus dipsaci TaxID=166011 RepID=A0A915D8F6_9BILA